MSQRLYGNILCETSQFAERFIDSLVDEITVKLYMICSRCLGIVNEHSNLFFFVSIVEKTKFVVLRDDTFFKVKTFLRAVGGLFR